MDDFDDTPPPWGSSSDEQHDELLDEIDLTQEEEAEKGIPEVASSVNLESEEPATLPNLTYSNSSDLYEVLQASKGESDWVLEGLIHNGDQVILGGPPKSYKSFWASHLAVALASKDEKFLNWKVTKKRRVLYISLEMSKNLCGKRLAIQLGKEVELGECSRSKVLEVELYHLFSVDDRCALDVMSTGDFGKLKREIDLIDPDFVIFDSLIRIHKEDENSNIAMSALLERLRSLCKVTTPEGNEEELDTPDKIPAPSRLPVGSYRTSLIVHHARKENEYGRRDYSASSLRGASSIHSEVDMAITLTSLAAPHEKAMNISARKVEAPEHEIIELDPRQRIQIAEKKGKSSESSGVIETRAIFIAKALKSLGRSGFHSWNAIRDKAYELGCPGKKVQGGTFSSNYRDLMGDKIFEPKDAPGSGHQYRLTEAALKMSDENIAKKILSNQNQKSDSSKSSNSD